MTEFNDRRYPPDEDAERALHALGGPRRFGKDKNHRGELTHLPDAAYQSVPKDQQVLQHLADHHKFGAAVGMESGQSAEAALVYHLSAHQTGEPNLFYKYKGRSTPRFLPLSHHHG